MTAEQILIVANVISFIGNAFFTLSSLFKSKKKIIAMHTSFHLLNSIAQFMQQAYSGMVQDVVMLVKNIVFLFVEDSKKTLKIVINVLSIIIGLTGGILITVLTGQAALWYAYCPVLGITLYLVCSTTVFAKEGLSQNETEVILKSALIFNGVMQCIYGLCVKLYPITIFNIINIVIFLVSIIRIAVSVNKTKAEKETEE